MADWDARGTACDHCGLALGPWPHERDVDGIDRRYCCYGCFIGWQVARGGGEDAVAVGLLLRLGVGGFLAMNIMLFSLAIYSRDLGVSDPAVRQAFHYVLWVFATPVMVLLGGPFFIEAVRDTLRGRLNASILITIGAFAAYFYSVIATLNGDDRVYFDTTTMVLGLFTLGRFLEANGRARAMRNLAPMLSPLRAQVTVLKGDTEETVPLSQVQIGDFVRVQPGDRISVDGVIVDGEGFVDETWLTGEGRSIEKAANSPVQAGTINLDGMLIVRATANGLATQWAGICVTLHDALARPTIIQTVTDRFAAWFVPAVLFTSFLTVWYWSAQGPVDVALMHGLAVLVVSCPCALGLAAPLATALALEKLASGTCLVRSGDALFRLGVVRAIAFDKTGTMTMGKVQVAEIFASGATPDEILRRAAAIETGSRHPVAKGIAGRAADQGLPVAKADRIRTIPGRGITGEVDGQAILVGTRRMFVEMGWQVPDELRNRLNGQEDAGLSGVYVGWDNRIYGLVLLKDQIRTETPSTVRSLQKMGVDLVVLSGDRPGSVSSIANECGIESWRSELMPDQKAEFVFGLRRPGGSVVMVGDGINDGLALQAADVGIAVGHGVDLARESADAVLSEAGLSKLPEIIRFANRVRRLVLGNLAWALAYNAIAIALAVTGNLLPVFAAALMAGSSFVVIANSLRLSNDDISGTGAE